MKKTQGDAGARGRPARSDRPTRLQTALGDASGAFADLGTFLPLVLGVLMVRHFDPTGLLVGFGLSALVTAAVYRRPVGVQPMKAIAAIVIATGISPQAVAAGGLLIGILLVLLAVSGSIGALARWIPQPVLSGVQLGIGLHLLLAGIRLVSSGWYVGAAALAALLALQLTRFKPVAALAVLFAAAGWALQQSGGLPPLTPGFYLPEITLPAWPDAWTALRSLALPQLPLTLANAVLAPAAIALSLFPENGARITARRLALSSGLLNVSLSPLGAFPMCHGAGGLVVQYKFGARTGLAPALFGLVCLALGLLFGPDALQLLGVLPMAAVGAMLVVAGGELAVSKRLFDAAPDALAVILLTGMIAVTVNIAASFLAGMLAEILHRHLARKRAAK
jgi:xanthine/uracil/vitamin C permease (AzgA family)